MYTNLTERIRVFILLCISGVEVVGLIKKKRIRRESLRQFYGNSVNSPNLTEVPSAVIKVRRSPRLAGVYVYSTLNLHSWVYVVNHLFYYMYMYNHTCSGCVCGHVTHV